MRCFTFCVFAAAGLCFLGGTGCRRPVSLVSSPSALTPSPSANAATETGKRLPDAARAHPAPNGTPGVDAAETAQAARPSSAPENLGLGLAYYKVGAWEQAIPALETASKLAPNDATPLRYLAYAQMTVGALSAAEKTLAKAAALPRVTPADKSDALLERGNCLYAQGDDKEACNAFTQSLTASPKQGRAALALGTLAAQNRRTGEAKTFFVRAARDLPAGPSRARAFACLGLLAESEKQRSEAAAQYQKALALDKQNAPAQAGLARLTKKS